LVNCANAVGLQNNRQRAADELYTDGSGWHRESNLGGDYPWRTPSAPTTAVLGAI